MYLYCEGNCIGNVSPSWGQPNTVTRGISALSRRRTHQGPRSGMVRMTVSCLPETWRSWAREDHAGPAEGKTGRDPTHTLTHTYTDVAREHDKGRTQGEKISGGLNPAPWAHTLCQAVGCGEFEWCNFLPRRNWIAARGWNGFWFLVCFAVTQLAFQFDHRKPTSPGAPRRVCLFTMYNNQEPGGRGPPWKDLIQILRGGSSDSGFLIWEHSK